MTVVEYKYKVAQNGKLSSTTVIQRPYCTQISIMCVSPLRVVRGENWMIWTFLSFTLLHSAPPHSCHTFLIAVSAVRMSSASCPAPGCCPSRDDAGGGGPARAAPPSRSRAQFKWSGIGRGSFGLFVFGVPRQRRPLQTLTFQIQRSPWTQISSYYVSIWRTAGCRFTSGDATVHLSSLSHSC